MIRRKIWTLLLSAFLIFLIVTPPPADSGIKQFVGWLKKGGKRIVKIVVHGTQFVVEVPAKLEYRMKQAGIPPLVAVFASNLLLKKALANPKFAKIFKRSSQIIKAKKNLRELDDEIEKFKEFYLQEAKKLEDSALGLTNKQFTLSKRLYSGEFAFMKDDQYKAGVKEFKQRWIAAEMMAGAQIDLAKLLRKEAKELNREKFIKLVNSVVPKELSHGYREIFLTSFAEEFLKSADSRVINIALSGKINLDTITSDIVEYEMNKLAKRNKFDVEAFKEKLKAEVKEKLKKDRTFFRNKKNLKDFIKHAVEQKLKKQKQSLGYLLSKFEAEPKEGIVPLTVKFDANASEGKIKEYKWDFGDNSDPGSGKTTSHTYTKKGSYEVELTIIGENKLESLSDSKIIQVLPKPQPPSITVSVKPKEVYPGGKVSITGKVTLGTVKGGILTITCKVGKQSLKPTVIKGELDYGNEIKHVYRVPENAKAGSVQVSCKPTIKLNKEDAVKFKKKLSIGKSSSAQFNVILPKKSAEKGHEEELDKELFVGTWAGTLKVRKNSSISLSEIKSLGMPTIAPLRFTISYAGDQYKVSGIHGVIIKSVSVNGRRLKITGWGSLNPLYNQNDKETFILTLDKSGNTLTGTHRTDFVPWGDDIPDSYREYQINDIKLHKQ